MKQKKICYIFLIAFIFSIFNVRVEAISPDTEDELTIEVLSQIASWEELVKTAVPISETGRQNIRNKEDWYLIMLIEGIDRKLVYYGTEYINYILSGINLKEIDYDSLIAKCETIVTIYNRCNSLQLVWNHQIINKRYMQVHITSTNVYPITIGQQTVKGGRNLLVNMH